MAGHQAAGDAGGSPQHTLDGLDFEDAARPNAKARIALVGPAGSGKTYTGLAIATGLGGTIGVIDTERGSAANYAGLFPFKHLRMPNSQPRTLMQALAVAADRRIDVVIVDSLTHFWSGKGGIIDQVDRITAASRSGSAFTSGWKDVRPMEQDMWDALLSFPGHVIATIRAKTAYEIQENANGKKEPVKLGLKPDQRDNADYEFDLVGDLNTEHVMRISKSRYPGVIEVGDEIVRPDSNVGQAIATWLAEGVPMPTLQDYVTAVLDPATTREQLLSMYQVELPKRGLLGAALIDPHTGKAVSLGELIVRVGHERAAAAAAALVVPSPSAATAGGPLVAEAAQEAANQTHQAAAPTAPPAAASQAALEHGVPIGEQQAVPRSEQRTFVDQAFADRVANGWAGVDTTQMALSEATTMGLVNHWMAGPDGEAHQVGLLLAGRLAELRTYPQEEAA